MCLFDEKLEMVTRPRPDVAVVNANPHTHAALTAREDPCIARRRVPAPDDQKGLPLVAIGCDELVFATNAESPKPRMQVRALRDRRPVASRVDHHPRSDVFPRSICSLDHAPDHARTLHESFRRPG